nr:hypothetical protein [Dechloromonas sp.]
MPPPDHSLRLHLAIAFSLALHALALWLPEKSQRHPQKPAGAPLAATLRQPEPTPLAQPPSVSQTRPTKQSAPKPKVLATNRPGARTVSPPNRQWSAAEKREMDAFLDELNRERRPPPSLAERSRAMAREAGRDLARQDMAAREVVERLPNSPEPDPFSLEMYLDAVVKKLNRSAGFVRNDPRAKGVRAALVRVQLNPNGTLRRFEIINAADQQDEIAFVRSVVEQAVPFSAFPADLQRSARSLGILICIQPPSASRGFGFSRSADALRC